MKISKRFLIGVLFIAGISCLSCKSAKKTETEGALEAPETEVENVEGDSVQEKENSEDIAVQGSEITGEAPVEVTENTAETPVGKIKKDEQASEQQEQTDEKSEEEKSEKKNYTGWIDIPVKNIDLKAGSLRIKTKSKLGTYNISVKSEDDKYIPVLSTSNEYTGSYYSLKVDKKIYKLIANGIIKTKARKNEAGNGISMFYSIENVADVQVDYEFLHSSNDSNEDMIKVTSTVINKGDKKAEFALKSILDTVLGETTQHHFYNSENRPLDNEVMYRTMQNQKWFVSKNSNAKMQLLFEGADISKIESVALANFVTLDIKSWEPEMLSYRSFNTVMAYSNSAVGITWPAASLGIDESISYVYYMAFATGVKEPMGEAYISSFLTDNVDIAEKPLVVPPAAFEKESVETITSEPVVEKLLPVSETVQVKTPAPEVPKIVSNIQFDVSKLTKEQLSPEYIQNLLDRISALEENDSTLNREELLQLNSELDAILEVLKQ